MPNSLAEDRYELPLEFEIPGINFKQVRFLLDTEQRIHSNYFEGNMGGLTVRLKMIDLREFREEGGEEGFVALRVAPSTSHGNKEPGEGVILLEFESSGNRKIFINSYLQSLSPEYAFRNLKNGTQILIVSTIAHKTQRDFHAHAINALEGLKVTEVTN